MDFDPPTLTSLGQLFPGNVNVNDATLAGTDHFLLNPVDQVLYRFDPDDYGHTEILDRTTLGPLGSQLQGLAFAPELDSDIATVTIEVNPTNSLSITTDSTWRTIGPVGNQVDQSFDSAGAIWESSNVGWSTSLTYDDSDAKGWNNAIKIASNPDPIVIWSNGDGNNGATPSYFRREFDISGLQTSGLLDIKVDDDVEIYINGNLIFSDTDGLTTEFTNLDITPYLLPGSNLVAAKAHDAQGAESFGAVLTINYVDAQSLAVVELSLDVDPDNHTWEAYAEVKNPDASWGIASFHFDVVGSDGIQVLDETILLDNTTASTFPLFSSAGSFGLNIHASQDTISNNGTGNSSINDSFGVGNRDLLASGEYFGDEGTLTVAPKIVGKSPSFVLFRDQVDHISLIDTEFADIVQSDTVELSVEPSAIDLSLVLSPTIVDTDGEIASLPENEKWIDEWTTFFIEIWGSTPQTENIGISSASLGLSYNTDYFTATSIEYGPSITGNSIEMLNEFEVSLENLGGITSLDNIGDDNFALLARIEFQSLEGDGVPFNGFGQYIQPVDTPWLEIIDSEIELSETVLAVVEVGEVPHTELWPVMYDMDDDGKVFFGDLAFFASVFTQSIETSSNDAVYASDFDHSGIVDFGDVGFLAANFHISQTDERRVVYPTNFPEAWRIEDVLDELANELALLKRQDLPSVIQASMPKEKENNIVTFTSNISFDNTSRQQRHSRDDYIIQKTENINCQEPSEDSSTRRSQIDINSLHHELLLTAKIRRRTR